MDEPGRSALDFALARLARRAHAERELAAKMERAGFAPEEIDRTLAALRERRYLDDAAFALGFARAAAERRCWGPRRIARALAERGVDEPLVEAALAEVFPSGEDEGLRRALARYELRGRPRRGRAADPARAYRHLVARGFSPAAVYRLVRRTHDTGKARDDNA